MFRNLTRELKSRARISVFQSLCVRCRDIHTLSSSIAFCAKGSLKNWNISPGEDGVLRCTWIAPGSMQGTSLIGVADGVGGWRRHGVDPSILSHGILKEMKSGFQSYEEETAHDLPVPQRLLTDAFLKLNEAGDKYAGGTTVSFGVFDPVTGVINVANLGDSGALVFRDNKVVFKTKPDVIGMTPSQLTIFPNWMRDMRLVNEDHFDPVKQTKIQEKVWQLEDGDIVVFATDGFFDNVNLDQAISIVTHARQQTPHNEGLATLAKVIGDGLLTRAYYNSLDPYYPSPFALRCQQDETIAEYWGGKPDDISLVVSVVGEAQLATSHIPRGENGQSPHVLSPKSGQQGQQGQVSDATELDGAKGSSGLSNDGITGKQQDTG